MISRSTMTVIHIHGHSMSSLYALRDSDPVLLGTTGYNHKIYRPRMQVCDEEVGGRVKVSLNLYRTVSKFFFYRMSNLHVFLMN